MPSGAVRATGAPSSVNSTRPFTFPARPSGHCLATVGHSGVMPTPEPVRTQRPIWAPTLRTLFYPEQGARRSAVPEHTGRQMPPWGLRDGSGLGRSACSTAPGSFPHTRPLPGGVGCAWLTSQMAPQPPPWRDTFRVQQGAGSGERPSPIPAPTTLPPCGLSCAAGAWSCV